VTIQWSRGGWQFDVRRSPNQKKEGWLVRIEKVGAP
jgi:hypothetical protein